MCGIFCLVLSVYAITVFGYIAATLASYFIGRDAAATVRAADVQKLKQTVDRWNRLLDKQAIRLKTCRQNLNPRRNKPAAVIGRQAANCPRVCQYIIAETFSGFILKGTL